MNQHRKCSITADPSILSEFETGSGIRARIAAPSESRAMMMLDTERRLVIASPRHDLLADQRVSSPSVHFYPRILFGFADVRASSASPAFAGFVRYQQRRRLHFSASNPASPRALLIRGESRGFKERARQETASPHCFRRSSRSSSSSSSSSSSAAAGDRETKRRASSRSPFHSAPALCPLLLEGPTRPSNCIPRGHSYDAPYAHGEIPPPLLPPHAGGRLGKILAREETDDFGRYSRRRQSRRGEKARNIGKTVNRPRRGESNFKC